MEENFIGFSSIDLGFISVGDEIVSKAFKNC